MYKPKQLLITNRSLAVMLPKWKNIAATTKNSAALFPTLILYPSFGFPSVQLMTRNRRKERRRKGKSGSKNVIQYKRQCIPVLLRSLQVSKTGTDGGKRGRLPPAKYTGRESHPLSSNHTKGKTEIGGVCTERQMEMNEDKIKEGEGLLGKKQYKS